MLSHFFPNQLSRGIAECVAAAVIALLAMVLARRRGVDMLGELPLAQLRGIAQIVAVGAILAFLLHGPRWTSLIVLSAMMLAAATIVRRRAENPFRGRSALRWYPSSRVPEASWRS